MPDVEYTEDDRNEWAAILAAAFIRAAADVRALAFTQLDGLASAPQFGWFDPTWWDAATSEHVAPELQRVAGLALDGISAQSGIEISDSDGTAIKAGAVAGALVLSSGRGRLVSDRADELTRAAAFGGKDGEWIAAALGVPDGALSGPLSDAVASEIGTGLATGVAQDVATRVIEKAADGLSAAKKAAWSKTWNCRFHNSRASHIAAHGQKVAIGDDFTIGGFAASRPYDPRLPVSEVANCACFLTHRIVGIPVPGKASAVPSDSNADQEAPSVTMTETAAVEAAPMEEESPPADLSTVPDEALHAEMARRITEAAVEDAEADGAEVDPAQAVSAAEAAEVAVSEAAEELREEISDSLKGTGMDEPVVETDDEAEAGAATVTASVETADDVGIPDGEMDPDEPSDDDETGDKPKGGAYDGEAVLTLEGVASDDGRMFAEGSLDWRQPPLPLMLLTQTTEYHYLAEYAGDIIDVYRDGGSIMGRYLFKGEPGERARSLMGTKDEPSGFRGISVDVGNVKSVYSTPDGDVLDPMAAQDAWLNGEDVMQLMVQGRLLGATLCPMAAFGDATAWKITEEDMTEQAVAAAGGETGKVFRAFLPFTREEDSEGRTALVAAAGVPDHEAPLAEWFDLKPMETPEPFTVYPDRRCYGLVFEWKNFHLGYVDSGRKVKPPRSADFSRFYDGVTGDGAPWSRFYAGGKHVLTREGTMVKVGPVIGDTFHPSLLLKAADTQPWYADTGSAWADVRLHVNEHGIVAAGAVRPDCAPSAVYKFRASDVSPDWRFLDGELKVLAVMACNVSAFQVEGIAASAGNPRAWAMFDEDTGECLALVAGAGVHRDRGQTLRATVEAISAELSDTRARLAHLESEHLADRRAAALKILGRI